MTDDAFNKGPLLAKNYPYTAACYHMIPAHACSTTTLTMKSDASWSYIYNNVRIGGGSAAGNWFKKLSNGKIRVAPSW